MEQAGKKRGPALKPTLLTERDERPKDALNQWMRVDRAVVTAWATRRSLAKIE